MLKKQRAKHGVEPASPSRPAAVATSTTALGEPEQVDVPLSAEELLEMELVQQRFQHWSGVQSGARSPGRPLDDEEETISSQLLDLDSGTEAEPLYDEPSDEEEDAGGERPLPKGSEAFSRPSTAAVQQVRLAGVFAVHQGRLQACCSCMPVLQLPASRWMSSLSTYPSSGLVLSSKPPRRCASPWRLPLRTTSRWLEAALLCAL